MKKFKKPKINNYHFAGAIAALFLMVPVTAFAKVQLEVGIGSVNEVADITGYIIVLYNFIISIIGVLSAVMIMYAGVQWAAAAGNSEKIGSAKQSVINAIVGLVIALTSYVLLNAINPSLVDFESVVVPNVATPPAPEVEGSVEYDESIKCDAAPELIDYEKPGVIPDEYQDFYVSYGSSSCVSVQMANALVNALAQLANPSSPYYGMQLTINSAFRTPYAEPNGQQSYHQSGEALDVTWSPRTADASYISVAGLAGTEDIPWHNGCICDFETDPKCGDLQGTAECTVEHQDSVEALNQMMSGAGFAQSCIEWWHHQVIRNQTCAVGDYRYNSLCDPDPQNPNKKIPEACP